MSSTKREKRNHEIAIEIPLCKNAPAQAFIFMTSFFFGGIYFSTHIKAGRGEREKSEP